MSFQYLAAGLALGGLVRRNLCCLRFCLPCTFPPFGVSKGQHFPEVRAGSKLLPSAGSFLSLVKELRERLPWVSGRIRLSLDIQGDDYLRTHSLPPAMSCSPSIPHRDKLHLALPGDHVMDGNARLLWNQQVNIFLSSLSGCNRGGG